MQKNGPNSFGSYSTGAQQDFPQTPRTSKPVVGVSPISRKRTAPPLSGVYSGKNLAQTAIPRVQNLHMPQRTRRFLPLYKIALSMLALSVFTIGSALVWRTFVKTDSMLTSGGHCERFENFLVPIVMHDPTPFNGPAAADEDMVISSSIWRILYEEGFKEFSNFDDQGLMLIPTHAVQTACHTLFGPERCIDTGKEIKGSFFSLAPHEENFHIGVASNAGTFVPRIENLTEQDGIIQLSVAYILRENSDASSASPEKTMLYTLHTNPDNDQLFVYSLEALSK